MKKIKEVKHSEKSNLLSIHFSQLKNLKDLEIKFDKPLTAIMGVNGCGKTTVLHALACAFKPKSSSENYRFSQFFPPNPDSQWNGSLFSIVYQDNTDSSSVNKTSYKKYQKEKDRWIRYESRPIRDVFYFGIGSCVPEIEKKKIISFISYITTKKTDNISSKCVELAATILSKDYTELTNNKTNKYEFWGVIYNSNNISFLSLGAGEQRIIKILIKILEAPVGSLILIDEIDLLLHDNALVQFIHTLSKYAIEKNLQIVFTTHSLLIQELKDIVDIRYIEQTDEKTLVYDYINSFNFYKHTGVQPKPIKIFVEDDFAKAMVSKIAKELNMQSILEIGTMGSCENAFTLAASYVLRKEAIDNVLIIIDGDVNKTNEEKLSRIKRHLTGTEDTATQKRNSALSLISQFNLPDKYPEKYIWTVICNAPNEIIPLDNEIKKICKSITNPSEEHKFITDVCDRLGDSYDVSMSSILDEVSKTDEWLQYTKNIREWLGGRKKLLNPS